MQQTMLAVGALLIVITLTLNQQRSIFLVQQNAYLRELESVASDFAKKQLHDVTESVAFDEARLGMAALLTATSDLTNQASFGPDAGEVWPFDDVDDYHAYVDTTTHVINQESYQLRSSYSVQYVDPVTAVAAAPGVKTLAKEVTINVETLDSIGAAVARISFQKVVVISDYL